MRAAVPDGKIVDAMISSNVKKTSTPLNGTEHEVCALPVLQFAISLNLPIFT